MGPLILLVAACTARPVPSAATPPEDLAPTAVLTTWQELAEDLVAPRAPSDGQGRLELLEGPAEPPVVGTSARYRFRFHVGPAGIAAGGAVQLVVPAFWGWSPPQLTDSGAPGFVVVDHSAALEVDVLPPSIVRVKATRALLPGETLDLTYGAGSEGARVDRFAERGESFWAAVDGDGDGVRALVQPPVRVDVMAGPAEGLVLTWPSTARPGDAVRLRLAAVDAVGNAAAWAGPPVRLRAAGLEAPRYLKLDAEGRASLEVPVPEAGIYRVEVEALGARFVSNPLVVHEEVVPQRWADLQVHSGASDGTGALDDLYRYARDVAGLDAVAITDHDHFGMRFLDRDVAAWVAQQDAAARWNAPGRFVTFAAYEWTSWLYGHRHVLYVGEPGPVWGSLDLATRTPAGLWAALAPFDAITIPHHVAGGPVALDARYIGEPKVEPVVEITSVHGSSEAADTPGRIHGFRPGTTARDLLLAGHRLGFVGSTDGHDGHPGLAQIAGGQGGLMALLTDDLTRTGIAAALRARQVYATNGPRIVLRTLTAGVPMGQVVVELPDPFDVEIRVIGTAPVARIDVIRGADVVAQLAGEGELGRWVVSLPAVAPGDFVYVRVLQVDGGAAWSSPVWLR